MSEETSTKTLPTEQKLDDVMLAMDIVDTLRHREKLIARELDAEEREARLITRLKDIYAAQGIEVPERILADGVAALEEHRFSYEPPTKGFAVGLAKLYIARRRWLPLTLLILSVAAIAALIAQLGIATAFGADMAGGR